VEVKKAYSTQEVAKKYGVVASTVRAMAKDGRLKAGSTGRDFRFSPEECDRVFLGMEPKEKEKAA
jgi:excisionase family DNA binding protein